MVIVFPAGAQIPTLPSSHTHQNPPNLTSTSRSQEYFRDAVASFVSKLDASSACSTHLHTLNIESVLPFHLKQRPTPREIGIVKFSLDLGVTGQKYHAFIDPGSLPRGFMHEAQYHSETHQIPVLDFSEETTDCRTVYREIVTFLNSSEIVFTASSLVTYTQEALDWIFGHGARGKSIRNRIIVLPLEMLAGELIILATDEARHTVRLTDELRPQILEHVTHFGCEYHASQDIPVCALSTSHRQALATHGLLQKYFWDHLTKLDFDNNSGSQQTSETSTLETSLSACTVSTLDTRHCKPAMASYPSRNHDANERVAVNESISSKPSQQQGQTKIERNCPSFNKARRKSDESTDGSLFSLPNFLQEIEDCPTETTGDGFKRMMDVKSEGQNAQSLGQNQNVQSSGQNQNLRNTGHSLHNVGQTKQSSLIQSAGQSGRRPGLGRGFLKTTIIPPRRPNS